MERQFLTHRAKKKEYLQLYRDTQPGQNVYWNGFGQPPTLSFRSDFDDIEFNRKRQMDRKLIKGRFSGGNLGWIVPEDLELFAALYRKPLNDPKIEQLSILEMIVKEGPYNIQQIKSETGMLVKQITPILHRLQEAFLIYEDQYDGDWDRGWYKFSEMFPKCDLEKYTRREALKIVLQKFAYRHVLFDAAMAKSFYKLPEKEINSALGELVKENVFTETEDGFMLSSDIEVLQSYEPLQLHFAYAMHRNDFIVKSNEHILKDKFKRLWRKNYIKYKPASMNFEAGFSHNCFLNRYLKSAHYRDYLVNAACNAIDNVSVNSLAVNSHRLDTL